MNEIYKVYRITHKNWSSPTVYEVSNYGNVKVNGKKYLPNKDIVGAYYTAGSFAIHRAVAELFVPNPKNKPEVDHIDGDTHNNNSENLRWVTHEENLNNEISRKRNSETKLRQYKETDLCEKLSKIHKQRFIDNPEERKKYAHSGWNHTEDTKQKLSEINKGENNPMYGKSLYDFMSDDKIQSWKQSLKGRTAWNKGLHTRSGENNPMYGKGTRIWVNNGTNNHLIKISEKDKYLNNGYSLGRK